MMMTMVIVIVAVAQTAMENVEIVHVQNQMCHRVKSLQA